jgi:hypothetical protein
MVTFSGINGSDPRNIDDLLNDRRKYYVTPKGIDKEARSGGIQLPL